MRYEEPSMEILFFGVQDIVRTSDPVIVHPGGDDGSEEDMFG